MNAKTAERTSELAERAALTTEKETNQ